jgi:hypothetical protein
MCFRHSKSLRSHSNLTHARPTHCLSANVLFNFQVWGQTHHQSFSRLKCWTLYLSVFDSSSVSYAKSNHLFGYPVTREPAIPSVSHIWKRKRIWKQEFRVISNLTLGENFQTRDYQNKSSRNSSHGLEKPYGVKIRSFAEKFDFMEYGENLSYLENSENFQFFSPSTPECNLNS